ncbi:AAA family ATPase [Sodalis sp. C49]|uniref:AAA family ATPase n=1 Tax=Sodalis sp. C49 TaxID=3228929 RepID=UPI003965C003
MINGIPASGKSTLAAGLSRQSGWLSLSLDGIKNPFLQHLGGVDRTMNRTLGKASYQVIWSIVAQAPAGSTFIIDAWFGFQPRELLAHYLAHAGVTRLVEVWCRISAQLAAARYAARLADRLPGHPGAEYLPELRALAERAGPMALGPIFSVDQDQPQDTRVIYDWIMQTLPRAAVI